MTDKTDDKRQAALECVRAHNAGHEALCLSETVVCSIARTDLEALMCIAKAHGKALSHPECESVTVEELASMFSTDDAMSKAIDITNTLDNLGLKIIPSNGEKK